MLTRVALLATPLWGALGYSGAEQVSNAGADLQGIALIISAVSGLLTTVTALVIALRRKPSEDVRELVRDLLREADKDQE